MIGCNHFHTVQFSQLYSTVYLSTYCQKTEVCSDYHKGRNARYLSPLIAKAITAEGYHQGLF